MKKLATAAVMALSLAAIGSTANAAVSADQIPSAMLSQCGLSGMQSLSDDQGMQIRAKGVITQVNVLIVYDPAPGVVSQQISQGGNNQQLIVTGSSQNNYVQQNAVNGYNTLKIVVVKGGKGGKP